MKRAITLIVALIMLILTISLLSGCNSKTEIWLNNLNVEAEVNSDGSVKVSERWEAVVNSNTERKNIYKTIEIDEFNYNDFVGNYSVVNAQTGESLPIENIRNFSVAPDYVEYADYADIGEFAYAFYSGGRLELGVFFVPTLSGTKDYIFEYSLNDVVVGYSDTTDFYWQQIGSNFSMNIENYTCDVTLPGDGTANRDDVRFWLHIDNAEYSDSYVDDNGRIHFEVKGIQPNPDAENGLLVETRILIPKEYFPDIKEVSGPSFAQIVATESAEYEQYVAEVKRQNAIYITLLVFGILFALAGVAAIIYFQVFFKRYKKDDYPPYVREIPANTSAAEMGYFFYHYSKGGDNPKNRGKMISATIMELARRGIIEFIAAKDEKADCSLQIKDIPEAELQDLKAHERAVYDMLIKAQTALGKAFTMDEFSDYANRNGGIVAADIKAFAAAASKEYRTGGYFGANPKNYGSIIGFFSIGGAILTFLLFPQAIMMIIGLAIFGGTMLFLTPSSPKLNKKGTAKYAEAQGLKNYMLEFSNLKEYEIPLLRLWEEYMVYATMMGISEEVIKELKAVYPEISIAPRRIRRNVVRQKLFIQLYGGFIFARRRF